MPEEPRGARSRVPPRIVSLARVGLVLLPLAYLAPRVDVAAVRRALSDVGVLGLAVALALQAASVVVGAVRWRGLLATYGAPGGALPPLGTLVRHAFVGIYFAMLPTGLVGDLVRARRTEAALPEPGRALVVALVDRLAGAFGLLTLGGLGLGVARGVFEHAVVRAATLALVGVALALTVALLVLPDFVARSARLRGRLLHLPEVLRALLDHGVTPSPAAMVRALGLSVATQGLAILAIYTLVARAAPGASRAHVLAALPWVVLATYVPVTPGGVGQRELVFVALLAPAGLSDSQATAASVSTMAMTWLTAAIGFALATERGVPGSGRPSR